MTALRTTETSCLSRRFKISPNVGMLLFQGKGSFGKGLGMWRSYADTSPGPSTPVPQMPQIIMMPTPQYQLPPIQLQYQLPAPAPSTRQSSPPAPEDPADLH